MSKILFYTPSLKDAVNSFMMEIQSEPEIARQYITFDQMSERTKVTLDSSANEVVSSIITITSVLNDVKVFVPWMSLIRGSLKTYIEEHNVSSDVVSYNILVSEGEEVPKLLSGETEDYVIKISDENKLTPDLFKPAEPLTHKILYIMKTSTAEEIIKNVTVNSRIEFTQFNKINDAFVFEEGSQIMVSIPQLQARLWTEMNTILESSLFAEPIDGLYIDNVEEDDDFFITSIKKLVPETCKVVYGEKAFDIVEFKPEEEDTNEATTEDIPSVDAEIVSE